MSELARRVRARELSPVELLEAHIARIEEVNPRLNAMIADRFEQARVEAKDAQERLTQRNAALPPLHGVPCTIKEFVATRGMPQTGGMASRKHELADADCVVTARLRAAGVIVMGSSNVPEGGMWLETHNPVFGRTNNPWNLARTAGGSSGGEGALVASGASPLGIGSDVGGSIRIPAAFCGTVGHKPSGRRVPTTGHYPRSEGNVSAYLGIGPLVRRVEDVLPILRVIEGPDGVDQVTRRFRPASMDEVDLKDITVFPVESNGTTAVSEPMRQVVRRAADALVERGAKRGQLSSRYLPQAAAIWSAMMASGRSRYAEVLGGGRAISVPGQMARFVVGRSEHSFPALLVALGQELTRFAPKTVQKKIPSGHALRVELEQQLGPRGVILHPPYPRTAPGHNWPLVKPFAFICTGIFNTLEFPVTVLPMGFGADGLPLGVQVAAIRGNDHVTCAVASALEQDFGGWVRAEVPA